MADVERIDEALLERAQRVLARRDPRLGRVIRSAGACGLRRRGDPYRYLVRSVLYQQLAGSAAQAIERRFRDAHGGRIPKAEVLAVARTDRLRRLGLSRQKAVAVRSIARAFRDGEVPARRLSRMDDDDIVASVTRIHGVGEWTAHMLLMSSLGRPDVLPFSDYGVRKGARDLYGLHDLPKRAELEAIAEPWRPFRSVASWYLWRVADTVTADDTSP